MAPTEDVDLGHPQFASHKWAEPIVVVTIMITSLIINRHRNYSIFSANPLSERQLYHVEEQNLLLASDTFATTSPRLTTSRSCCDAPGNNDTSRYANHLHSRILQKFPFLVEMFYWALNYLAYSVTKAAAASQFATVDGVTELAQDHGISILEFEQNSIFALFFPIKEVDFQAFFTTGHPLILTFFNRIYSLVHIPGTVAFLSWYYYSAPDHSTYAIARRTMTLGNFAAFIIFCFYPCMPPRLLPSSFGFHDTVRQDNAESVWVGGKNVNQLAAMPSLHFTYAFVIGSTFVYHSGLLGRLDKIARPRSSLRMAFWLLLAVLYPVLVLSVIVATANHYWLDAVVAVLTTSLAFLCNRVWILLLPAENVLLWILKLKKPVPTTGQRSFEVEPVAQDQDDSYRHRMV